MLPDRFAIGLDVGNDRGVPELVQRDCLAVADLDLDGGSTHIATMATMKGHMNVANEVDQIVQRVGTQPGD